MPLIRGGTLSLYLPTWNTGLEPNEGNVRQWLDNLYSKFQPIEQSRWNQSNIDTLFYAGAQNFVNRYFNFSPTTSYQQYYFNIIQQPVNMVTGYERQNRKGFMYQAREGGDPATTDQYTKLVTGIANSSISNVHEQKSKAKELAAVSGLCLLQPYLDFTGDDPAQGEIKVKIWEYNSFLVDPYARDPGFADAQFIWCQEYISKHEAEERFPDKVDRIHPMAASPQRYGSFYFLPENYNMARNDLLVVSYVWFKAKRKKKRLYSNSRKQFFDFAGGEQHLEQLQEAIPDIQVVTVETPTWRLAVVLNDVLMFLGDNPLGFDDCPFVPYYWNYEPHQTYYDLRVRSLVRSMRDCQFLFNFKVISNNDIAAATINAGWKRKIGAVANEDNLKKSGQGWDVIINHGFEMTDVEKIIPSAVPESDLALAEQMRSLMYECSGINLENWSGQQDKQISSLTLLMKQAANLMIFQKYFDQWDYSDRLLGNLLIQIPLHNWNAEKVALMIGEEPTPHFYSKVFSKYQVVVEECDLTPTQQNLQAQKMMEINERFQREVFPPSMIIPKLNITGKSEIIPYLQEQEQKMAAAQEDMQVIQHSFEEAKLKELITRAASNLANARERHGRAEADIGLYEERLSEITQNRAMATKAKMEALEKLVDVIAKFGEIETMLKLNDLQNYNDIQIAEENIEKQDARHTAIANEFRNEVLGNVN